MASNPQHEPTMEEILASIRKIISEDSSDSLALDARSNGVGAQDATEADADVYDLREDDIVEELPPTAATPPPTPPEPVRVAQIVSRAEVQPIVQPDEEPQVTVPVSPAASSDVRSESAEGFFSDNARKAMHETFARLEPVATEEPVAQPTTPAPAVARTAPMGASVQDVFEHAIREMVGPMAGEFLKSHADEIVERMKPIVREWMDEHFPAILEGAVRNEVERAVKAAAAAKPRR